MSEGEEVLLLLGGDRGDLVATFGRAIAMLGERAGQLLAVGRDHWTEPWGIEDDALFLNRAVLLRTQLSPHALLGTVLDIERTLGRVRPEHGGPAPRCIDIDILLMGDRVMNGPVLQLPHPRMHQRRFALAPAADVAPGMRHPVLGRTVLELLDDLRRSSFASEEHAT